MILVAGYYRLAQVIPLPSAVSLPHYLSIVVYSNTRDIIEVFLQDTHTMRLWDKVLLLSFPKCKYIDLIFIIFFSVEIL